MLLLTYGWLILQLDEEKKIRHLSEKASAVPGRIKEVGNTKDKQEDEDKRDRDISLRSRLLSFSHNFIAGVLLLSFIGYKLDEYFENDDHFYLLIGIFLGFFWSMYETFKLTRYLNK